MVRESVTSALFFLISVTIALKLGACRFPCTALSLALPLFVLRKRCGWGGYNIPGAILMPPRIDPSCLRKRFCVRGALNRLIPACQWAHTFFAEISVIFSFFGSRSSSLFLNVSFRVTSSPPWPENERRYLYNPVHNDDVTSSDVKRSGPVRCGTGKYFSALSRLLTSRSAE